MKSINFDFLKFIIRGKNSVNNPITVATPERGKECIPALGGAAD